MRIVQIQTQQEARRLQTQLIPDELEGEARVLRERELKMMNPQLDLQAVKPGDVVLVPDELAEVGEPATKGQFVEAASLAERVAPVKEALEQAITIEADERELIRRDLRGRAIKEAAEQHPAIAAQVERVREQLTQDAREAKVREQQLASLIDQATGDFEALQKRFGLQ